MRRLVACVFTCLLAAALLATASPAAAISLTERAGSSLLVDRGPAGPGVFISENVEYLGTIPIDSPGVGGKVVKVGDQTRFFVTGVKGISIYDVTDPELPVPLGTYPFLHAQNEDVEVSEDGKRLVIAADGSILVPIAPQSIGVHVFDVSDPLNIKLLGSIGNSEHTATCADPNCEWIYGRTGNIYDARNPASMQVVGNWQVHTVDGEEKDIVGQSHALIRDETGLILTDTTPRLVLDPRPTEQRPAEVSYVDPLLLTKGDVKRELDGNGASTRLQHNSVRPRATEWQPRAPQSEILTPEEAAEDAKLRPGELLIGNSESNLNSQCSNAGGLSTWSMRDFEKGTAMDHLAAFKPLNGTWSDGKPGVNALGCSGHWFTVTNDYYVAAGWYEHGIHFFQVDPTNGAIKEVGFFQPVATEASAAHWVDDEYVYTVDYARGVDILKFNRTDPEPTQEQLDAAWLASLGKIGQLSQRERYLCGLASTS